ncbi:hypothetical protein L1785_18290 [Antribacter sp. KLBMP9083]|uniref:Uncharacterized protein n=1 Tax=Antribacter soli TaxID=2910976 RepID=A0AA41QHQ7_9MICO|nr:hypothetical protein [Antribacter soli]MCF4122931.1 hypothetical protein [Antribacter soli]
MTTDAAAAQTAPVEDQPQAAETAGLTRPAEPAAGVTDAAPEDGAPATQEDGAPRTHALESQAAERLHRLLESGVEKLPGEVSGTVSRVAVALAVFGSEMTKKDQEKPPTALAAEAVGLFRSLDDGEPQTQRAALETALSTVATTLVGDEKRNQALDVADEAISLWKKVTQSGGGLAKSDAILSLRELAGTLRKEGRDDDADETESEARRLEA